MGIERFFSAINRNFDVVDEINTIIVNYNS